MPPKKKPAKKFTQEDLDAQIEKAREEAREEARQEALAEAEENFKQMKDEFDIPEAEVGGLSMFSQESDEFETHEDQLLHDAEAEMNFDIFNYIEESIVTKGIPVSYQIRRGGAYLGEYPHPFSWAQLKSQFGGGLYTIVARHAIKKTYVKKQTLQVEGEAKNPDHKPEEPRIIVPPQPAQPNMSEIMMPLLEFMKSAQENAQRDTRTIERDERKSSELASSNMTQLLTTMQTNSQNMFQQMQQSTMSLMEKMNEASQKMYERINDKFDRQMEAMSKDKEKGLGTMELITLLESAKSQGRDDMQMLFDMIEAKTAEKAGSGEEESKIGKLITSMLPLVQMGLTQAQNQPQLPPQQQVQPQPGQRRVVKRQRPAHGAPGTTSARPKEADTFSTLKKKAPVVTKEAKVIHESGANRDNGVKKKQTTDDLLRIATPEQIKICEIAIPSLFPYLEASPTDAAQVTLGNLEKAGLNQSFLIEHFNFDFLWSVAKSFDISDDKKTWFEVFYANIQNTAGDDAGETELAQSI